ncbi:MAG: Lrp/AsnC family transcriptional regulator [DPANN group archaeon]|nr:Lrp/AsnC family transcriptional regulator [DPANN group archaeon]
MLKATLGLDDKDVQILSWFMETPEISQNEIAERLKLSQPSVNVRIQKLKKRGILNHRAGINLNTSNLIMIRVDFTAADASATMEELKRCTFFVNGFIISGKNNASAFFVHDNIRKIEDIINQHLRNDPSVSDITVNVVVSATKEFIFTIGLMDEMRYDSCKIVEGGCKGCSKMRERDSYRHQSSGRHPGSKQASRKTKR